MACSGTPTNCEVILLSGRCEDCGCDWDYYLEFCEGIPTACADHLTEGICEDCGCTWTPAGLLLNIGDVWKDVNAIVVCREHPLGGHAWYDVIEAWVNVGDVWKRTF